MRLDMSWIYESFEVESDFNGTIKCRRYFGAWEIWAGQIMQSGEYITKMWAKAIKRVPADEVKSILVLGLGTGGCLGPIQKRFKKCKITVIEIDPVMVKLAERLKMYSPDNGVEIILEDASDALPKLEKKFDLIIWDLFVAGRTAEIIHESGFMDKISAKLERNGYFILNYYREPEEMELFDKAMARHRMWRFRYNGLALYRHFGRGHVGDPLPDDYAPYRSVRPYLERESSTSKSMELVGTDGRIGSRWHHGPLWFEGYTGDEEPKIESFGKRRMVIWQPITRTDNPGGWRRSWVQMNPNLTGFADLKETEPYWSAWTPHAQRHRQRWLKKLPYEIREITSEQFLEAYSDRSVRLREKFMHLWLIRNKIRRHGNLNVFFGAVDGEGKIIAGFAAVDIPEASQSMHVASFIMPIAKKTSVGTGLVDAWFQRCLSKGLRFADFDLFWAWGDPWSWRGFSRFKSQFGVTFIRYPKPLVRFVGGQPCHVTRE